VRRKRAEQLLRELEGPGAHVNHGGLRPTPYLIEGPSPVPSGSSARRSRAACLSASGESEASILAVIRSRNDRSPGGALQRWIRACNLANSRITANRAYGLAWVYSSIDTPSTRSKTIPHWHSTSTNS
jgi:hypothetical protein